jgi:ribulose-5-phosphate 4-epimerase/fuculose-1-phosphate aldolase
MAGQDPRLPQLIAWARRFAALGFPPSYGPGDHGNLSCRTPQGLVVSARETAKASLRPEQFVEVIAWGKRDSGIEIRCRGRLRPSTDTLLHLRLYELRPDIHAILHGHDAETLHRAAALSLPVTERSAAVPSEELVQEVCELAKRNDYIILRDHGFLALGPTVEAAGRLALSWSERARQAAGLQC